jgi:CDP-diacylglycerol--glycerol-3-phosphate 3-phosphatidyltransferase
VSVKHIKTSICKNISTASIANILTLARLFVVFVIFLLYWAGQNKLSFWVEIAFFVFLFGAISDYFDGFFARKYNSQSNFGICFDPICDKIFVYAMLLLLFKMSLCNFLVIFLIISRELLVSGIRDYLSTKNISMPVSILAKYKTGFQMSAIGILLFYEGFWFKKLFYTTKITELFFKSLPILGNLSMYIALILTLYTGYLYLMTLIRHLQGYQNK